MPTRRTFLKALVAGAAGLALPLDAAEALVAPERRLWALDGTMLDAGPPNVAKVPLGVEYTVYSDGTVVGPTVVLDGRRLPVVGPIARMRRADFPAARGVSTAAEIAAFRHINRLAIATFEPGVATVVNRSATP